MLPQTADLRNILQKVEDKVAQTRSKIQRQLGGVVVHDGNGLARETNCDYLGKKEAFAQQQQTTSAPVYLVAAPRHGWPST